MFRNLAAAIPEAAHASRRISLAFCCLALLLGCASAQPGVSVPDLVKFSGTISATPAGTAGVIFALYQEQTGGAPLWQEVQSVSLDAGGRYSTLLGSHTPGGIPVELFRTGEARWLGVQAQGQPEQPRVLLVSVPYALKAADSETLAGLPASAFLRAANPSTTYLSPTAVNSAAAQIATAAALTPPLPGSLPMYTDASGALGNSLVFQSGNFVGINTANPAATLNLVGANPTLRVDNYSNVAGDSPNFNFLSAHGAVGAPTPTLSGDNLGQFAAAGYTGSAFPGSKVKVTFIATQNWTPTANGAAMSFQTTANGTTARTERMRIDHTGNVGIGIPAPAFPLSVAGIIQSTSGGFKFPDGSTQLTAAANGVFSLSAADSSIAVAGTPSAPTVAVAANGITDAKVHDVSVTKVSGAASTQASNLFTLPQTINVGSSGSVALTLEADAGSAPNALYAITHSLAQNANAIYAVVPDAASNASAIFGQTFGSGVSIYANANSATAMVVAVEGDVASSAGTGLQGYSYAQSGNTQGVVGRILSPNGVAILGKGIAQTCNALGVCTPVAGGTGGVFQTFAGGTLLLGQAVDAGFNPTNVFRVDSSGKGFFNGGIVPSGADFAESVAVVGDSAAYSPGDLITVDPASDRQFTLVAQAYSTLVAGIYATRPGILATAHSIDDPRMAAEIPLAIVGIVPCKVTAENGPIRRGDLLVSSSTPGRAMKGTDRPRMLGAVVGKALGSLPTGTGVIEVLVTLQ